MTKMNFLISGTTYDTEIKTVEIGQIVRDEGFGCDRYAVYDIVHDGYRYQLINLRTFRLSQTQRIRPLSERCGVGFYYDDSNPETMTAQEVAELKAEADRRKAAEDKADRAPNTTALPGSAHSGWKRPCRRR